jgi:hypothetical protein
LSWRDFFHGTAARVEAEVDLSHKHQFLDLIIIRAGAEPPRRAPDGFEPWAPHNLISFKSYQDTLDDWALQELGAHYVNYRKQASPDMNHLLPVDDFRLIAVSARFPRDLAKQVALNRVSEGVYTVQFVTKQICLVVIAQLPRQPHNAMLHVFSADESLVEYGATNYQPYSSETSSLLLQMIAKYRTEGIGMRETLDELARRVHQEFQDEMFRKARQQVLEELTPQQRLEGVPVEKRLEGVPVEKRLEGVPVEKRLEGVPVEKRLEGLSAEQRLAGLSAEEREKLLRLLQGEQKSADPK